MHKQNKGEIDERLLGIIKTYRVVTLTVIASKVYNAQLPDCIRSEVKKILRKFLGILRFTTFQFLTIHLITEVD